MRAYGPGDEASPTWVARVPRTNNAAGSTDRRHCSLSGVSSATAFGRAPRDRSSECDRVGGEMVGLEGDGALRLVIDAAHVLERLLRLGIDVPDCDRPRRE